MSANCRGSFAQHQQEYRERSSKPAMVINPNGPRACPFCGQPEIRSQFRNGRCRPCRKAQK